MDATVSVPWMCEMSKLSMRLGSSGRFSVNLQRFADGLGCRLQHAEALLEGMLRVVLHQIQKRALAAPLRRENFHLVPRASLAQAFLPAVRGPQNRIGT